MTEKTTIHACQKFSRELGRWLLRPRWRTMGQRWTLWARTLSERHGRVAERYEAPELALVRRLPLMQVVQQRWLVSLQRFFPRINLAIHPILRQLIWREQTLLSSNMKTTETKSVELRRLTTRQFMRLPIFLWPEAIPDAASRQMRGETPQLRAPLQVVFQRLFHIDEESFKTRYPGRHSLPLSFQRFFPSDESVFLTRLQSTTQENVGTLVERIVRQSRRVEERITEAATVVMRRPPVVDQAPATTANQQTFVATPIGPSWQQYAGPSPGINIEHITDQVMRQLDRRVIAARERLGKV